jgi:Na+/phosphate symporter
MGTWPLFLGMKMMSESLRKVAGNRLKNTLDILTRRPIIGLFIGTLITMLVQSSGVTTVMTVGFFFTMFGKTRSAKMWGNFILGFGLLFTGLLNFGTYPILGILFGMFITVLLQSSSAIMVPICFDLSSEHSILVQ